MIGIALSVSFFVVPAFADDTIKIGYIDPLSGGGASIGEVGFEQYAEALVDYSNTKKKKKNYVLLPSENEFTEEELLLQQACSIENGPNCEVCQ